MKLSFSKRQAVGMTVMAILGSGSMYAESMSLPAAAAAVTRNATVTASGVVTD